MYCSRCGAPVKENAVFCAKCGNRLNNQSPAPTQSFAPDSNAPNQGYTPGPTPAPNQGYVTSPNPASNQGYTPYNPYSYAPPKPQKSYALAIVLSIVGFLILAVAMFFIVRTIIGEGLSALRPDDYYVAAVSPSSSREGSPGRTVEATEEPEEKTDISDSELIDYFCEVGLNVEYGGTNGVLKRWEDPIRVKIEGDYTSEDYATLTNHIDTLNGLGVLPDISIVSSNENFSIYFVPLDQMDDVLPGYVEGNWGYFYLYWGSSSYVIDRAYMGIATDVTSQAARNHLILEEFTQALGLMDDSYDYGDSIFQAEWTTTPSLSDVDYMLIYILYSDYLEPGMTEYEVRQVLNSHLDDILPDID